MTFLQIIDLETSRPDDMDKLYDEWLAATEGKRTLTHERHTQDRDNPKHFVDIAEFPSYEQAMRNNDLPETRAIAERMKALCDSGPRFVNLDVLRER
jgi:hypothetical protein